MTHLPTQVSSRSATVSFAATGGAALLRAGLLGLALIIAAPPEAHAQAACTTNYTKTQLSEDIGQMTSSLRSLDERAFKLTGQRIEANLACLRTPVPPLVFAYAYRYIGAYHFLAGDIDLARRWFRSGIELDPAFDWDVSELDVGHPLRRAFDEERNAGGAKSELVAGTMLNVAAGSSLSLDGRPLKKPSATPGRPHLVQVVGDDDQSVRKTYLIDGNNFPAELLQDESMAAAVPSEEKGKGKGKPKGGGTSVTSANPNDAYAVQQVQRVRPKAKTPMLISGGVVALGAGALYGVTFLTHQKFEDATTSEDMERYRSLTNTLVIGSGATLAVGLGVEYAGIMLGAGGTGFRLGGHF
jgi:hypothetical protein